MTGKKENMDQFLTALQSFWTDFYSNLGLSIARALSILVLGIVVVKVVRSIVKRAAARSRKLDSSAISFIVSLVSVLLYAVLIIWVIISLGLSAASVISAVSAVLLAIGLALQDTLASLANGIIIIFTKPFKRGDYIEVDGAEGYVKEIRLFNTTLVSYQNVRMVVPNSAILNSSLKNYTAMPLRRVDIQVPIPYDADLDVINSVFDECIKADERIVNSPAPSFGIGDYSSYAMVYSVKVWTVTDNYWDVFFAMRERIIRYLGKRGITIPVNRVDVSIKDGALSPVPVIADKKEEKK